jgi:hypothetical protein
MIMLGGLVVAIGSILPWAKAESIFGTVSKNGTQGDGMITLVAGIVAILAGVIVLAAEKHNIAVLFAALAALGILVVTIWNFVDISGRAPGLWTDYTAVKAGEGIYIALLSGALVLIGTIVERVGALKRNPQDGLILYAIHAVGQSGRVMLSALIVGFG